MNKEERETEEMYFIFLIGIYQKNECNRLDALLEDLESESLKHFVLYIIDNLNTLPKINIHILVKLILDYL